MGKRLRNKIIELEDNFQDLVSKLANLAFVGTKPTYPDIDWSAPKHTVTLDLTGVSNASVLGTWPKQVVEGTDAVITVEPIDGYILSSVTYKVGANGATQQAVVEDNQAVITVNVTADVTIYITAAAGFRIWLDKSIDQNGIPVTDSGVCYTDFIKLDGLTNGDSATANYAYQLAANPDSNQLKYKRCVLFYDKNKRQLYYDSKWDAIWHPADWTQSTNNSRELTNANLTTILSAAGQNTPVYARFSFGVTNNAITTGCGFTQGSKQFVNIADAIVETTPETVHNLSFSLTHCSTPSTNNQSKALHGQPIEILIKADSGYNIANLNVAVTVGGEAVQAVVSNYTSIEATPTQYKKVVVENVTGDVVVTASI